MEYSEPVNNPWGHIVDFFNYCPKCKHFSTDEADKPCDECLETPYNTNGSKKPVKYEEE